MRDSKTLSGKQIAVMLALAAAVLSVGCKDESDGGQATDGTGAATETNAQPAPCDHDSDCPDGIACVFPNGAGSNGFCNVNEMEVADAGTDSGAGTSSAAPAPCLRDGDCPGGIVCIFPNGDDAPGFCDVDEMIVSPSAASPAPCTSDDDCPADIDCVFPNGQGASGFCDVREMLTP